MARKPRLGLTGVPQQVIQRGNNRKPHFLAETDCQFYRECIRDAVERYRCAVPAHVPLTYHAQRLPSPEAHDGVPRFMQHIARRYAQDLNFIYRRSGIPWEGRYKASLMDVEHSPFALLSLHHARPGARTGGVSLVPLPVQCFGDCGPDRDAAHALPHAGCGTACGRRRTGSCSGTRSIR